MTSRKVCMKCNLLFEVCEAKQLSDKCIEDTQTCKYCSLNSQKDESNIDAKEKHKSR